MSLRSFRPVAPRRSEDPLKYAFDRFRELALTFEEDTSPGGVQGGTIDIVDVLPAFGNHGRVVFLTTTNKLYRDTGTGWVETVPAGDITGQIVETQLGDGSVTTTKIGDLAVLEAKIGTGSVTTTKIGANAVTDIKIADLAITSTKLADQAVTELKLANSAVTVNKLADGTVTQIKMGSGLFVPEIVATLPVLPSASYPDGATVVLNTDWKLYRNAAGTWTAAVPTVDLTGQITETQITDLAISTPKLAANAVTAAKIQAGTITSTEIAADTITAGNIAVGAIGATEIAAGAVIAGKIAADAVGATEIVAGSVTTTEIAANTILAGNIAANTITGSRIALGTLGSQYLDGLARSQHGVFLETFEVLPDDWNLRLGERPNSLSANGQAGGNALVADEGTTSWIAYPQNIPYDPSKLYRIRARVRMTVAPTDATKDLVYFGVEGVAADGVTLVNTGGTNSAGSQHYVAANGVDMGAYALGSWQEFTGWFEGHGTYRAGGTNSPILPSGLHANVRYFRPLAILNYSGGDGTMELDYLAVDVFDEDGLNRTYLGLGSDGVVAADKVATASLQANAVTAAKIAADTITATEIAADAITATELATDSVTSVKILAGAVTAAKISVSTLEAITADMGTLTAGVIRDANSKFNINLTSRLITMIDEQAAPVTRIKIGELSTGAADWGIEVYDSAGALILGATGLGVDVVGSAQIADLAVLTAHIADLNVTNAKIADLAVTNAKINDLNATKINAGFLAAARIEAGSLHADKITANTITSSHITGTTLSAIRADLGTITAGWLGNAAPASATAAIRLSGTTAIPSTNFIDFTATGANPWLKNAGLTLNADGSATFSGTVASTTFSAATATFEGGTGIVVQNGSVFVRTGTFSTDSAVLGVGYTTLDAGGVDFFGGNGVDTTWLTAEVYRSTDDLVFDVTGTGTPTENLRLKNAGGAKATGAWDFTETPTVNGTPIGGGASALNDLSDVTITAAAAGDYLRHNGTAWVDSALIPAADLTGTIDSARLSGAYTGITGLGSLTGLTVAGSATIGESAAALSLKAGATADHVYMQFYADSAAQTTRSAYIGFGSAGSTILTINNELGTETRVNGTLTQGGTAVSLSGHTHDDRYYTEAESDSRFANVAGDTFTGMLKAPDFELTGGVLDWEGNAATTGFTRSYYQGDTTYQLRFYPANTSKAALSVAFSLGVYYNGAYGTVWHSLNDGSGSGLDSDTVDGLHSSAFATAGHSHDASDITSGTIAVTRGGTGVSGPISGNLLVGAGTAAMTHLAPSTAGGYVRSNGTSWVRNSGVPASDVSGTFSSLTTSGLLTANGGSKISVQEAVDGGSSRGLFMWQETDTNWGIYMSTSGAGKSLAGGTAVAALNGRTSHHIRFRVSTSAGTNQGFLWENGSEIALMDLTADTGNLRTKGTITATQFFEASSRELKQDIAPFMEDALAIVRAAEIVNFAYRETPSERRVGVIAEDAPRQFVDADRSAFSVPDALAVSLRAIQQLEARVAALEAA